MERYITLLDILGFGEMVKAKPLAEMQQLLGLSTSTLNDALPAFQSAPIPNEREIAAMLAADGNSSALGHPGGEGKADFGPLRPPKSLSTNRPDPRASPTQKKNGELGSTLLCTASASECPLFSGTGHWGIRSSEWTFLHSIYLKMRARFRTSLVNRFPNLR
jgi:hypothetical protein